MPNERYTALPTSGLFITERGVFFLRPVRSKGWVIHSVSTMNMIPHQVIVQVALNDDGVFGCVFWRIFELGESILITHKVRLIQRRFRARQIQRKIALHMCYHPRLGAQASLSIIPVHLLCLIL